MYISNLAEDSIMNFCKVLRENIKVFYKACRIYKHSDVLKEKRGRDEN